ncbi:FtsX-like permease family protein [Maioricimonas sp. JC845]|uniref:FtsX-like permease family protein n=1 Tax=Maioricimonas sp. JC845 TaxID=3232138 RepID=UPI00345841CF
MNWKLLTRLVVSQMLLHPGRAIVTTIGIVASTCAVVWVVSGYDALISQFDENARKYLGRYDALIIPAGPPGSPRTIDDSIVESLRRDAGVMEINPVTQTRVSVTRVAKDEDEPEEETPLGLLIGSRPPVYGAPPIDPLLVSTPAVDPPYELVDGTWLSEDSEPTAAVMSVDAANDLGITVGEEILITSLANQVRLSVVGLVEQAPDSPSLSDPGRGGPGRGGPGRGGPGRGGPGRGGPGRGGPGAGGSGRRGSRAEGGRRGGPEGRGGRSRSTDEPPTSGPPANAPDAVTPAESAKPRLGLPDAFVQGVATRAAYVRPQVAERINGFPSRPNVLQVALRDTVTSEQFQEAWNARLEAGQPPLKYVDFDSVRSGMESTRTVSGQKSQAWAATGMAALAAIFIILSTLSMGVTERSREFAVLRTVALTRSQIAAMIVLESGLLALIGWLGGLLAGAVLVTVGSNVLTGLFSAGTVFGWTSVALTGLTVLAGAVGAAILPIWRAVRIAPLEAMSIQPDTPRPGRWSLWGIIGLLLAALTPLIVFVIPIPAEWRTWSYSFVAYPALLVGMVLMAPAIVVISERVFGPLLATILRLDSRMVSTQLSSNMWRTIGATLALSVGLGLFVSTQTWGYSMLQPFLPGAWLPDMLVAFHPIGLDDDGLSKVKAARGINADEVLPLAIEQARFATDDGNGIEGARYDNAVIFGLDPQRGFGGDDPFLDVQFVEGDRNAIARQLADGSACVISQDFQMSTGLGTGDELSFTPPNAPDETVTYRIAGVVSLPGWHWITKFSGVRRHFVRTATMIFANRQDVMRDFHLARNEFYWLNTDGTAPLASIEADLQQIAEENSGAQFEADGLGSVTAWRPFARATATETVRRAISMHASDTIWRMSHLPLVTLAIMSLAVANTVIASVRSRTWEFGVMRSIGFTNWQLVRLIIAETILIGLAACAISLSFGLIGGWSGVGMARYGRWFAGPPTFVIPWAQLAFGFTMTVGLCLAAAIWPALRIGRAQPLALLQAGRSAT